MSDGKYDAYLRWQMWPAAPQWSDLFAAMEPVRRTLSPPQQEANALEHRDLGDEDQPSIHHSIHSEQADAGTLNGLAPISDEALRGNAAYPPLGSEAQRILTLEAQVAQLRAAIEALQAAAPQKPVPQPEQFPANALRHAPKATIP